MRPCRLSEGPVAALVGPAALIALILGSAAPAEAQTSGFSMLRYEDAITEPPVEAAGETSLKRLRLDDKTWVSFGGELRSRLEHASEPSLGQLGPGSETYGLHRGLLHADVRHGEQVRAFVQLGAFLTSGKDTNLPPARDELDVQQAFLEIRQRVGAGTASARLGRQEIAFGSQRLIGLRDGPNARRTFDGGRFIYEAEDLRVDVLALRPVAQAAGVFDNRTADGERLHGVYATFLTHPRLPGSLDLYALGFERDRARFANAAGPERRWSWGARSFGRQGGWDWDVEATFQTGEIAAQRIRAWGLASDWGYQRPHAGWDLRFGLKANISSGDRDPADGELNTGNALYPKLPYLGSAAAFAPANIMDVHPNLTLGRDDLSVTVGYQAVWRQSVQDAVYVAPLIPLPGSAGRGGRFTAHQWPIDIVWRASRHWQVDAALAWVKVAGDLKQVGARDSAVAFVSVTYRF